MDPLLLIVIGLALLFAFSNGFHDTSSVVANSVASRALTPFYALILATAFNFIGALIGEGIAHRLGEGLIEYPRGQSQVLPLLAAAVLAALLWNLFTWWLALPSSSTHALIGGLLGAGLVTGAVTHWETLLTVILLPLVVSPLVGFLVSMLVAYLVIRLVARAAPAALFSNFRSIQSFSTAALALAHGIQDAQKTAAVIMMALAADDAWRLNDGDTLEVSWTVRIMVAIALAVGTYTGGWRIVRTMGERLAKIDPVRGFVSDVVSSSVLYIAAFVLRAPISMTYTVTSSIVGAAVPGRRRPVDLRVLAPIVGSWIVSLPATAILAGGFGWLFTLSG
ncbi:inorganic phosphate transporter [Saxibacter everestensis]|uniref:Inorganic phosphate transporter n=1 Tax=Saxibacter everestensis TaxID=2909229 RepID=A0ABY8QVU4_9MICO|nr:inorganic phosphate transporter [Brevibacteriaceae bacterium ZFBP1038]